MYKKITVLTFLFVSALVFAFHASAAKDTINSPSGNKLPAAETIDLGSPANNTTAPNNLSQITTGETHACYLDGRSGKVLCWGGTRTTYVEEVSASGTRILVAKYETHSTPIQIAEKNKQAFKAIAISAGSNHTCAIKKDRSVWCWPTAQGALQYRNQSGELGDGTNSVQGEWPVQVLVDANLQTPLQNVKRISAGGVDTCALKNDGTLWCWGGNGSGVLGNGTRTNSNIAVPVDGNRFFHAVSVNGGGSACAIDQMTQLWCWGETIQWVFGQGNPLRPKAILDGNDMQVTNVRSLARMPTADRFMVFQKNNDETLWGIGIIPPGRNVGGPNTSFFDPPTQFVNSNQTPVRALQATTARGVSGHACVLNANASTASCWGINQYGELGIGPNPGQQFPSIVQDAQGGALANLYQIEAGGSFTCALQLDQQDQKEKVWCWGWNNNGQLGNGTTNNSNLPVQVKLP